MIKNSLFRVGSWTLILLVACEQPTDNSESFPGSGQAEIQFSRLPASVNSVSGSLKSASATYEFNFSHTTDTTISFSNIPTGRYDIEIKAYEDTVQTWTGESEVVVKANETSTSTILMQRLRGHGELDIIFGDDRFNQNFILSINGEVKEYDETGVEIRQFGSGDYPGWLNQKSQIYFANGSNYSIYNASTGAHVQTFDVGLSVLFTSYSDHTQKFVSGTNGNLNRLLVAELNGDTSHINFNHIVVEPFASPVDDWIYYSSAKTTSAYDIYKIRSDGSGETPVITDANILYRSLGMSSNGRFLLTISHRGNDFSDRAVLVKDLTNNTQVEYGNEKFDGEFLIARPAISPDLKYIFFIDVDTDQVCRINFDGSGFVRLTNTVGAASSPRTF